MVTSTSRAAVLQVLREHRETLISVMETFVHDPLCEWTKRQQRSSVEEIDNPQAKDALATVEGMSPQLTFAAKSFVGEGVRGQCYHTACIYLSMLFPRDAPCSIA